MAKKTDRQKAVARADAAFSLYIRQRDGNQSVTGGTGQMTCSHLFSRTNYSTRWDEMNAFCQSSGENMRHEFDPSVLTMYFINRFGVDAYEALSRKFHAVTKLKTYEIEQIADDYQAKYKELKELAGADIGYGEYTGNAMLNEVR